MKILFIADTHLGAESMWGISAERYDAPFREAVEYAILHNIGHIVLAGDAFMKRNPTTSEYLRFLAAVDGYTGRFSIVEGNHDVGTTLESVSTTQVVALFGRNYLNDPMQPTVIDHDGVQIVCLPWPRPVDYINAAGLGLEETVNATRAAVMYRLREICNDLDPTRPAVLTGHAMVSYGGNPASAPNLGVFGKDILLSYEELCSLPNIGGNVFLGHVHDPGAEGYIGSTQPTDFGDVGQVKTFTVIEFGEGDDATLVREIPYETSLKIDDVVLHDDSEPLELRRLFPQVDIRRIKAQVSADSTVSEEEIREFFADCQGELRVEITRERVERERVVTEIPVGQMGAREAFETWCRANDIDATDHARLDGLFVEMLEAVTA